MAGKTYRFQFPVIYENCKDTLSINDSAVIILKYDNKIMDLTSNEQMDLTNFVFTPSIHCNNLLDTTKFFKGFLDAEVGFSQKTNYKLNISSSNHFYNIIQKLSSSQISDSIFISFKKQGVYAISVYTGFQSVSQQTFINKCPRSSYRLELNNLSKKSTKDLSKFAVLNKYSYEQNSINNSNPEILTYTFVVK